MNIILAISAGLLGVIAAGLIGLISGGLTDMFVSAFVAFGFLYALGAFLVLAGPRGPRVAIDPHRLVPKRANPAPLVTHHSSARSAAVERSSASRYSPADA
ncbi:hypothetical protein FAZ78_09010 [Cereibacter changlensis]|uniref:Uncharacterized protein n=1 Tax=Cereibacter changlensis TaxID=402884 RepID=A0A4U0YVW5_9RHOB|nr:hypothetical protein [Cereibacter changlensis]TKA96900.1 hypothetical protein FAZ78_09010 [Cereibacter changlensis]